MAGQLNRKLVRYVLAGGISFLFEYVVFIFIVYEIGLEPEAGQAISYVLTLIVNFILLRRWTFKLKGGTQVRQHLVKYCLLVVFNLPATTLLIGWLTTVGVVAFIAKIAVVALTAVWNYIVYDKLIFKKQLPPEDVV